MNRLYENQLFKSRVPFWRVWTFLTIITALFVTVLVRAVYVQLINSDFYIFQGEQRHIRNITLLAPRGNILDANGNILAESVEARSLAVNPKHYWGKINQVKDMAARAQAQKQNEAKLRQLAQILQRPYQEILRKFNMQDRSWMELKKVVTLKDVDKIKQLNLTGLEFSKVYYRQYPLGEAAAQIVGVTNVDGEGQEGVELVYNDTLKAKPGSRKVVRDSKGKVIDELKQYATQAVAGENITLTLDHTIQSYSYKILKEAVLKNKAQSGSLVVLDARNGDILSLVNYPSYDPQDRKTFQLKNMRNKVLTDMFEPGSTMKPFTIAAALEAGIVSPQTVIDTEWGRKLMHGKVITDVSKNKELTVAAVIAKSSNVGTATIMDKLNSSFVWSKYKGAGFGEKPKINIPGLSAGTLRNYKKWRPIEKVTMGYGYGLSVSLLQLARAYTVFTNNGRLLNVNIIKNTAPPPNSEQVFSAKTVQQMKEMLLAATIEGGGVRAQTLDYEVGGKSGTAKKVIDGRYVNRYRSWFTGFAPVNNPRVVVAVMIDEPVANGYYGGLVAAPIFSEVVQQTLHYLGVKPDKQPKLHVKADKRRAGNG